MTQERVTPTWEPTEEEIAATVRATDGYLTQAEAEVIVAAIAPRIAARALREAAESLRDLPVEHFGSLRAYVGLGEAITLLRFRAAALETPQETPDAPPSQAGEPGGTHG